jgi:hypothetical protein
MSINGGSCLMGLGPDSIKIKVIFQALAAAGKPLRRPLIRPDFPPGFPAGL